MPGAYCTPFDFVARQYRAGVGDYAERATAHTARARDLAQQTTGRCTTPSALRLVVHEHDKADQCLQASVTCNRHWNTARNMAHAHASLCKVRTTRTASSLVMVARTTAQVAGDYTPRSRETSAPPGALSDRAPLATCHASNAPGLISHALTRMETAPT